MMNAQNLTPKQVPVWLWAVGGLVVTAGIGYAVYRAVSRQDDPLAQLKEQKLSGANAPTNLSSKPGKKPAGKSPGKNSTTNPTVPNIPVIGQETTIPVDPWDKDALAKLKQALPGKNFDELTEFEQKTISNSIEDAWGWLDDDEDQIYDAFKIPATKLQVAQVAARYESDHGNLRDALQGGLSDEELAKVDSIVNSKPDFQYATANQMVSSYWGGGNYGLSGFAMVPVPRT